MSRMKAKGTRAETLVVEYLRARGWLHAERRAARGTLDAGDVAGIPGLVIEVKDHQRLELAAWLAEAEQERANARADVAVVWHKRRGKGNPADWYVTMSGGDFTMLVKAAGW